MAAPIEECFGEKLRRFRQLLHDTAIDSAIIALLCTEHNMSLIRDLTLCVQVTENRTRLTAVDVSNVLSVAAKLVDNIFLFCDGEETDSYCTSSTIRQVCCQKAADQDDDVKDSSVLAIHRCVEILTEYIRFLRNACANCISNQSAVQKHKRFVCGLARGLTLYVSSIHLSESSTDTFLALKTAGPVLWRCAVQFACNAVNCHVENAALFWDEFSPAIRSLLDAADEDARLKQYTCCLLYQCLLTDSCHYTQLLVCAQDNSRPPLIRTVLSYLLTHDCEWGVYLCEKVIASENIDDQSTIAYFWSYLPSCHKKYLLELVHRSLEQITSSQESSWDRLPVSVDNMLFLADQFVLAVDMLPTLLVHSDDSEKQEFINDSQPAASYRTKTRAQSFQTSTDSRVLFLADYSNHSNRRLTSFFKKVPGQECDIILQLLCCLCEATMHRYTSYSRLHDKAELLCSTLSVLKSLHSIEGLCANTSTATSATALNTSAFTDVYNVKSELMRLLANLVYQHTTNQQMVRDLDGIALILDHTSVDANNPYIVQWSVLAVCNLCEENEANQRYIADMRLCGPTSRTVDMLSEIGVRLTPASD